MAFIYICPFYMVFGVAGSGKSSGTAGCPRSDKGLVGDFMSAFDHYMENNSSESEEAEENGTGEADI